MNEMRKLMEAVANPPQKLTEGPAKIWFYGDEDFEVVSGPVPAKFFAKWIDTVENDYDKLDDLAEILASKTSREFARVFNFTMSYESDIPLMKSVLQGGSGGFGEAELVAGMGPTKAAAKKEWEALQDNFEVEDEDDWDF